MAYYGSLGDIDVGVISKVTTDTATDVFVYDTRKDSDGGAWRKRTQHTSWYNETLNTATRGSRRDFPAVAVIVATSSSVTIYDGDDPDMPMWMVFNTTDGSMLRSGQITSISILNAELWVGHISGSGVHWVNFLKDTARWITASSSYGGFFIKRDISRRNESGSNYYNNVGGASDITIAGSSIHDVAMTVLPNAPIDPSTSLSVPTIAVATEGGVSVIKDDGTVINGGEANVSWNAHKLFFDENNNIWACEGSDYSPGIQLMAVPPYSSVNSIGVGTSGYQLTTQVVTGYGQNTSWPYVLGPFGYIKNNHTSGKNLISTSSIGGLTFISDNAINRSNSMVAYATTSYNTGWMHGDIKGAWLSDTSTASVTGTELVTNGDMSSSTGWSVASGISISGGVAVFSSPAHGNNLQQTSTQFVSGRTYIISFNVTAFTSGGVTLYANYTTGTTQLIATSVGRGVGVYFYTWTASTSGTGFTVQADSSSNGACILTIDNVSVRIAELDRSVNNKGLAVYGTITKSAVATGSNLVAYGGFTGSNYLLQPYNSALTFGTGNYCIMGWVNTTNTGNSQYRIFLSLMNPGGIQDNNDSIVIKHANAAAGGNLYAYLGTTDFVLGISDGTSGISNIWTHFCLLRNGTTAQLWINGRLNHSKTVAQTSKGSNSHVLTIGKGWNGGAGFEVASDTSVSLIRISATAPSPEQILKIYNDEKALFQSNSQCTLYGSSDAVTALAYDDTTKLLSVGTSSGRSDFQGLERVANTTTAVTTAISASNGLIAEQ